MPADDQLGEGYVLVSPRLDKPGFDKAGQDATKAAGDGIGKGSRGLFARAKGAGRTITQGMAQGIGIGLTQDIGGAAAALVSEVVGMGASLERERNKVGIVFGDMLDVADEWAEGSASAMGLTTHEAKVMAAGIQDLVIPMGFARDEATDLTLEVADLAGALAEWDDQGRSATEVGRILSKSLLGERDALKELGVSISEADVQQGLLEIGMKDATGQALEQAKATVTLALLQEKSVDAVTSYNAGTNETVRAQNEARAAMQTAKEELATSLQPAILAATEAGAELATIAGNLTTTLIENKETVAIVAAAYAAFKGAQALGGAISAMREFRSGMAAGTRTMSAAGPVIALTAAAVIAYNRDKKIQQARIEGVTRALLDETSAMEDSTRAATEAMFGSDRASELIRDLGIDYETLEGTVNGNTDAQADFAAALEDSGLKGAGATFGIRDYRDGVEAAAESALTAAVNSGRLTDARAEELAATFELGTEQARNLDLLAQLRRLVPQVAGATDDLADATSDAGEATEETVDELEELADAATEVEDSIDKARAAIEELTNQEHDLDSATMDLHAQFRDLTGELKENGDQWDIATEKGADNMQQARDTAAAILDYELALLASGTAMDEADDKSEFLRIALAEQLSTAGLTADEVDRLIDSYSRMPTEVRTRIVTENVKIHTTSAVRHRLAHGGTTHGGPVLVGEDGPEIANLPAGTTVTPATRTRQQLDRRGAGAGITIGQVVVQVDGTLDLTDPAGARDLASALRGAIIDLENETA
jgi:hypothetical protein